MVLHVGCCSTRLLSLLVVALTFYGTAAWSAMVSLPGGRTSVAVPAAVKPQSPSNSQIMSYREWKLAKISESEGRVKNLKETISRSKGLSLSATEAGLNTNLQGMLDKEELQFSLAQDLTITDYFVGYLTKQKSLNQAIKEVSGRLSPEEVAELMMAYADNFFSSKPPTANQPPKADSGL